MFRALPVLLFCFPFLLIGQQKELQQVTVEREVPLQSSKKGNYTLTREFIVNKQAEDIGDLMKYIPGITLKNYGGIGGLKTISSRGINGNHIGVLVDGFLIQNTQVGQIDLSGIQVDNTEELRFDYLPTLSKSEAVGTYFNASNLSIQSFENKFNNDSFQLRLNLKVGSFGLKDLYLSNKYSIRKSKFSWFTKLREADGNFSFETSNLNHSTKQRRTNNDLKEMFYGLNYHYQFNSKAKLLFMSLLNFSDKGLPGAVILYNPTTSQRLKNNNASLNIEHIYSAKNFTNRTYLTHRYDEINYLDSGYLNTQGYLKSLYFNSQENIGSSFLFEKNNKSLCVGLESTLSFLNSNQFDNLVFRHHEKLVADFKIDFNKVIIKVINGIQFVATQEGISSNQKLNYTPSIGVYASNYSKYWGKFYGISKRTMRMPSFSELFYNQLGNKDLKPEISNLLTLGSDYEKQHKSLNLKFSYNFFSALIENKIVAIPTKNLFIWSIQNIGKVISYGSEVFFNGDLRLQKQFNLNFNANYTFQHVLDFTDKSSATYLNQIAYIPVNTINLGFGFTLKNLGLSLSYHYTDKRYALNENITSNIVSDFNLVDCTFQYQLKYKLQKLKLSFTVKNLLDSNYEYIRNYAMPGRNFLINLSYAIR